MSSIFEAKNIHLVGIGGISMSSIAHILLNRGIAVSGSDQKQSHATDSLIKMGANIHIGHSEANIDNPDIIIYTSAIDENNPELIMAKNKNIPLVQRTKALNDILIEHPYILAVSGTHGKSTTTSMVAQILRQAFGDVSYMIGAELADTNKAYHITKSDYIAVEACEYQANFLNLYPTTIAINNIEQEHIDFFSSIEQLVASFNEFASHLPANGYLILNRDDRYTYQLATLDNCHIITFGIDNQADYHADNITMDDAGQTSFDLVYRGDYICRIQLNMIGKFNVYNALSAIAATHVNGIDFAISQQALAGFQSAHRRFETVGYYKGAQVVSDYGHHPTAVRATLESAKKINGKKICIVYQPHTYSRTKTLLSDYASAFSCADEVIITDIYAARETNPYNVHSSDLVNVIHHAGQSASYVASDKALIDRLDKVANSNTLIIMMGAGDIDDLARDLVR